MAATTIYWRPGCPYCMGLFRGLERAGFGAFDRIDIWEQPAGAAFVRSVADGNETVPTVQVGDAAMVNPSPDEVLAAVAEHAPDDLPRGWEPSQPGTASRLLDRLLGGG